LSSRSPEELLNSSDPTLAWDVLSEKVEAFVNAWEAGGDPPRLADFLPARPAVLRQLTLVELIKVDLEYRWQRPGESKKIEGYVADFPELVENDQIPCDLVYEEYHVRKQAGDPVDSQEYFERFPGQATELGRLLGMEAPNVTTSISGQTRLEEIDAGQQIDDFDLLTRLGRGAFATVFLARQQSMQRIVAVKISADRGNEPQMMALLDHPHIVRVFDQRQVPDRKLRLLYMQYIPGGTLQPVVEKVKKTPAASRTGSILLEVVDQALLNRGEAPPADSRVRLKLATARWPDVVCWIGARLASALDYAHHRGVLHRDVKPANVLVTADGSPKLADFNISFCSKVEGATAAAYFGGSLAYMSPEQLEACNPANPRQADALDGRSDVYSLGVLLWELLTGSRPFMDEEPGHDWAKTLERMAARRRLGVGPSAMNQLPKNCPPGLEQVLLMCLAPEPEDRFATAGQLARQLELCLQPRAQQLLRPPSGGWRGWARRYALVAVMIAGLTPNLVATGLNLWYNIPLIFGALGKSARDVLTDPLVMAVNTVAYTAAVAIVLPVVWPVIKAVRRAALGTMREADRQPRVRDCCLSMPHFAAMVGGVEWLLSGIVYPISLSLQNGSASGLVAYFVHFMASQVLCGLIASTLAFFSMSFLAMRVFYPALFEQEEVDASATVSGLQQLDRRTWIYFGLAVAVVPIALVLMVLVQAVPLPYSKLGTRDLQMMFGLLGLVGLVNVSAAFVLLRAVQRDIAALAVAASPGGAGLGGGEAAPDSFWTLSR
jgi:eukaryotic-like serine/threonine-protein kinase